MSTEHTVIGFPFLDTGWKVYRIETASSRYHLGVFPGDGVRRRCAVLKGTSHGRHIEAQDSAPLLGGRSLFDVPESEWIGHSLEVGTARTSPIRSVEPESDR